MVPPTLKTLHKKTTATLNDPQQQITELNMFEVYMLIFFWYRSILWSSILKTFHGKRKQTHWYPIVSPWSHIPANSPRIFPDRPFLRPRCEVSWLLLLEPRSKCPSVVVFKLKRNEAQWKWKKVFPSPKMLSTSTKTSSNGRWVSKKRLAACAKGAIKMFIAMLGSTSPNLFTCVHFMEGKECACGWIVCIHLCFKKHHIQYP